MRYSPISRVLIPRATYYQVIRNRLKRELGVEVSEKKLPFGLQIPALDSRPAFNLKLRHFPPNVITVTVELSTFSAHLSDLGHWAAPEAFERNFQPVSDVVQWTVGLVQTLDHRHFEPAQDLVYRPVISLLDLCPPNAFPAHFNDHAAQYVALLIRSRTPFLAQELIDKLLAKNEPHNQKSLAEKLLIDKQGLLYLKSELPHSELGSRVLTGSHELFEIASVFREWLVEYFWLARQDAAYAYWLLCNIRAWVEKPEVVFFKSVTHQLIWKLMIREFKLSQHLAAVLEGIDLAAFEDKCRLFSQSGLEWWHVDDFPAALASVIQAQPAAPPPDRATLIRLRRVLNTRFTDGELRTLCFDLGIDYESLPGETKGDKARELLVFLQHRHRIAELVQVGRELRPDIPWDDA